MAKKKTISQLSYEEAFQELETTVHQLESGELPLEEALELFERGQKLASRCSALLEKAELKLRELMPEEDGSFVEAELEPE